VAGPNYYVNGYAIARYLPGATIPGNSIPTLLPGRAGLELEEDNDDAAA
jgi:hypothetical protein